jgi:hypothetical protein
MPLECLISETCLLIPMESFHVAGRGPLRNLFFLFMRIVFRVVSEMEMHGQNKFRLPQKYWVQELTFLLDVVSKQFFYINTRKERTAPYIFPVPSVNY